MKKIKAKYVDGVIKLPDDVKIRGEMDVSGLMWENLSGLLQTGLI